LTEEEPKTQARSWKSLIAPLSQRLRLASMFPGLHASWDSVGSKAFLEIIERMAYKLDIVAPQTIDRMSRERDEALLVAQQMEAELMAARLRIEELENRLDRQEEASFSGLFRIGRRRRYLLDRS